MEGVITKKW